MNAISSNNVFALLHFNVSNNPGYDETGKSWIIGGSLDDEFDEVVDYDAKFGGNCYQLNGYHSLYYNGYNGELNSLFNSGFSIDFWAKFDDSHGTFFFLGYLPRENDDPRLDYGIRIEHNIDSNQEDNSIHSITFRFFNRNTGNPHTNHNIEINDFDQWNHIAISYDSTDNIFRYYFNGNLVGYDTIDINDADDDFTSFVTGDHIDQVISFGYPTIKDESIDEENIGMTGFIDEIAIRNDNIYTDDTYDIPEYEYYIERDSKGGAIAGGSTGTDPNRGDSDDSSDVTDDSGNSDSEPTTDDSSDVTDDSGNSDDSGDEGDSDSEPKTDDSGNSDDSGDEGDSDSEPNPDDSGDEGDSDSEPKTDDSGDEGDSDSEPKTDDSGDEGDSDSEPKTDDSGNGENTKPKTEIIVDDHYILNILTVRSVIAPVTRPDAEDIIQPLAKLNISVDADGTAIINDRNSNNVWDTKNSNVTIAKNQGKVSNSAIVFNSPSQTTSGETISGGRIVLDHNIFYGKSEFTFSTWIKSTGNRPKTVIEIVPKVLLDLDKADTLPDEIVTMIQTYKELLNDASSTSVNISILQEDSTTNIINVAKSESETYDSNDYNYYTLTFKDNTLYTFINGNLISTADIEEDHPLRSSLYENMYTVIGTSFLAQFDPEFYVNDDSVLYMDDISIYDEALYTEDFEVPTTVFEPESDAYTLHTDTERRVIFAEETELRNITERNVVASMEFDFTSKRVSFNMSKMTIFKFSI